MDEAETGLLDAFLAADESSEADALALAKPDDALEAPGEDTADEVEATEDEADEVEGDAEGDADESDEDFVEFDTEDGQTERVALSELLEAHRSFKEIGSNANQIRQQIAEEASQEVTGRIRQLDEYINETFQAYELVSQLMPSVQEPDPVMLDEHSPYFNPQAYREQQEAVRQVREIMEQAKGSVGKLSEQRQKAAAEAARADANKHWAALTNADPTWTKGDPARRLDTLRGSVAELYGFSPQEIGGIYDHRFIRMAEDAAAFRKAQKGGIKPKAKTAPRLVKAGANKGKAATGPDAQRKAKAAAQLRKTGKVSDLEATWGDFV